MQANNSNDTSKKKYFVFKLIPHRPIFAGDMTEGERDIMKQHVAYCTEIAEKRIVIVFGPVLDPKGIYRLGIIEVKNEDQAHILAAKDPAVESGLQRLKIYPMRATLRE